jgi:DGQHR domain-containing protein
LSISGQCASYDEEKGVLSLRPYTDTKNENEKINYNSIANVLDGQHRIEGFKESTFEGEFEINVSIFIDIDIADQAYIFSTINLAQTKVNRSLVYDLFSLAKKRSPQKTCHNIVVALDKTKESPFYQRIKRLGVATEGRFNETLTQAQFVQALLNYISKDPMKDRDIYLRGGKPQLLSGDDLQKYIFGNMFIEEKDFQITDILWNYFKAIELKWTDAWNNFERGNMLNKTNGFRALIRFLRDCYLRITSPGEVPSMDDFSSVFQTVTLRNEDFTIKNYEPGSSGEGKLYRHLLKFIR